ncbi:helix-turn-helix domain-containing protein [Desulfitobacterium metallireducens]|uniref:DNA-binding protein n=1 Tax=Desulfitobacterium metallireducens DSM 15288 TaxID=871968 RepID=W0EG42_9FIRM|nr:helix-turn-helix transcriptional regulator [Desulfitobacterium metallireducens]AHF08046.1 DNA-binding protein [Desulfitobacterium metallireducens DSM 15288]
MEKNVFYGGGKLRISRLKAGIATQKELAERTQISPSIISDLERGRREMNATWAMRIAEVVGTPWKSLLEEETEGKV